MWLALHYSQREASRSHSSLIVFASIIVDKIKGWQGEKAFSQYTDSTRISHSSKVSCVSGAESNYHLKTLRSIKRASLLCSPMTENSVSLYVLKFVSSQCHLYWTDHTFSFCGTLFILRAFVWIRGCQSILLWQNRESSGSGTENRSLFKNKETWSVV